MCGVTSRQRASGYNGAKTRSHTREETNVEGVIAHPDGILALDSGYCRESLAAIHLVMHQGQAAVVDTGTNADRKSVV